MRRACWPIADMVIVGPAGVKYIQESGPRGAQGAAGSIYKFVGIYEHKGFPEEVKQGVNEELRAILHDYGKN